MFKCRFNKLQMSSISLPKVNSSSEENIKCYLRCKPLSQSELDLDANCIKISSDRKTVNIDCSSISKPDKSFPLDLIFPSTTSQSEIFSSVGLPMLSSFINGYNCTIFAYGQTGAGKTHTILGPLDSLFEQDSELHGLVPRILSSLFDEKFMRKSLEELYGETSTVSYKIKCSCLEIYQEHLVDLLGEGDNENLVIREDQNKSMYVDNLTKVEISNETSAKELLVRGMENRHVASTKMNSQRSRSHLIFTIFLETSCDNGDGKFKLRSSRLNVIDLAGSERQKATEAIGDRLKEAGNINKSLSILGNVINALIDAKTKFVPFRDSKLTYLLKDSLGGNSKTMIIANISQSVVQFAETLSTLKFVQRAKMITNKTAINENISDVEKISNLESEIRRLKEIIKGATNIELCSSPSESSSIDEYNDLLNKLNVFIGYEELICKKLKFLDLIGVGSLKQFMDKKKKFEDDLQNFSDSKVSLLRQELELYKHISQYYANRNLIENCQSTFTSEFTAKLRELHERLISFFGGKFGAEFEKKAMIVVDRNEYQRMTVMIKELEESEEEKRKTIERLENENFLIKMEMMRDEEEKEEYSTPKKENGSERNFLDKLRQSLMKPNETFDSNNSKMQSEQFLNMKMNYENEGAFDQNNNILTTLITKKDRGIKGPMMDYLINNGDSSIEYRNKCESYCYIVDKANEIYIRNKSREKPNNIKHKEIKPIVKKEEIKVISPKHNSFIVNDDVSSPKKIICQIDLRKLILSCEREKKMNSSKKYKKKEKNNKSNSTIKTMTKCSSTNKISIEISKYLDSPQRSKDSKSNHRKKINYKDNNYYKTRNHFICMSYK